MRIKIMYTGMNLRVGSLDQLERLKACIEESRAKINGKQWTLIIK